MVRKGLSVLLVAAMMMLAAGKGSKIVVETQGDDEQAALDAILKLIADKYGEGE